MRCANAGMDGYIALAAPGRPDHRRQTNFGGSMSIFGKIMNSIFGSSAEAAPGASPAGTASAPAGSAPAGTAPASVDVAPILDKAVAAKKEKLEWRTSIVDLMKALDIDSSLSARKELAKELGYSGDTGDSASMNIWLHKQVMAKLAANGGKLPAELKD
jgi:hypothetical protein